VEVCFKSRTFWRSWLPAGIFLFLPLTAFSVEDPAAILARCQKAVQFKDLQGELKVTIRDLDGRAKPERRFKLFAKRYPNREPLWSKMLLVATAPKNESDNGYIRWQYTLQSGKQPDQWLYTSKRQQVRRFSKRDPATSDWSVLGDDLEILQLDNANFIYRETKEEDGKTFHVFDRRPPDNSNYRRLRYWFLDEELTQFCLVDRIWAFDANDELQKETAIQWRIEGVTPVRQEITVKRTAAKYTSSYAISQVTLNVGLPDSLFEKAQMQRNISEATRKAFP